MGVAAVGEAEWGDEWAGGGGGGVESAGGEGGSVGWGKFTAGATGYPNSSSMKLKNVANGSYYEPLAWAVLLSIVLFELLSHTCNLISRQNA